MRQGDSADRNDAIGASLALPALDVAMEALDEERSPTILTPEELQGAIDQMPRNEGEDDEDYRKRQEQRRILLQTGKKAKK